MKKWVVVGLALLSASVSPGQGQQPSRPPVSGGVIERLGQPRLWHGHVGSGIGLSFDPKGAVLLNEARIGLYTDLTNPLIALLGFQAEIYGGARSTHLDYGLRTQLVSPYFRVAAGFDINLPDRTPYAIFSLVHPVRRGGIMGSGSLLRVNFVPARDQSLTVGWELPIARRINMGQTRPRATDVKLDIRPAPLARYDNPPPALLDAMNVMSESALWIVRSTVPFLEQGAFGPNHSRTLSDELKAIERHFSEPGSSPLRDVELFHAAMEQAFSIASDGREVVRGDCSELARRLRTTRAVSSSTK